MSVAAPLLRKRLEALHQDLSAINPDAVCAWPLARVFNALLAETREHLSGDPVVTSIASLKPADKSQTITTATHGTARALTGQLLVALSTEDGAS